MTAHQHDFDALLNPAPTPQPGERLLVTGGRDFRDRDFTFCVLDQLHDETPVAVLIHGDATGADRLAAEWAVSRGVTLEPHPADWSNIDAPGAVIRFNRRGPYNAAAGKQRNTQMVFEVRPSVAVAFPGGTGTDDCCKKIQSQIRTAQRDPCADRDPIRFIDHRNHGRTTTCRT